MRKEKLYKEKMNTKYYILLPNGQTTLLSFSKAGAKVLLLNIQTK